MTKYVILVLDNATDPGVWQQVPGHVEASSAARALAAAKVGEGTYVAVPVRSWKQLTVTVETTTKVTIG